MKTVLAIRVADTADAVVLPDLPEQIARPLIEAADRDGGDGRVGLIGIANKTNQRRGTHRRPRCHHLPPPCDPNRPVRAAHDVAQELILWSCGGYCRLSAESEPRRTNCVEQLVRTQDGDEWNVVDRNRAKHCFVVEKHKP